MMTKSKLISHVENHLGQISRGWTHDEDGVRISNFQMILVEGNGLSYYVTLGLSNVTLRSYASSKDIFQEIIMITDKSWGALNVQGFLYELASQPIDTGIAYLRGDTVGAPFLSNSGKSHIYFSVPVYIDDGFHTCWNDMGKETVFSWAIPISTNEYDFVIRYGWEEFEDLLERENPDLADLLRPSLV